MIDGDGWVGNQMSGICGTQDIVLGFMNFISNKAWYVDGMNNVQLIQDKRGCSEIRYQGQYVRQLLQLLYSNCLVSLDRKHAVSMVYKHTGQSSDS